MAYDGSALSRRSALAAFLLALFAVALPAGAQPPTAQPPPDNPQPDVTVRGQQERALRAFVEALSDPARSAQLARWEREICPAVIGIDPAEAAFMENRIGEIAAPLGLRRRRSPCLTTMLIVITADAAGLATAFARHYPVTLRTEGRARLNRFAFSSQPVRWISVIDLCARGCADTGSRLTVATYPEFQAMIVIVDAARIAGFSLGELSDYVALVALGNPPLARSRPSTSILSMFELDRPPGGRFALTANDQSFLDGLYRTDPHSTLGQQRAAIARRMGNEPEPAPGD